MERQLFDQIVRLLQSLAKGTRTVSPSCRYTDSDVLRVYFWAVLHDRPMVWACQKQNWPIDLRRRPLISCSRLSRRLRSPTVIALLAALEERIVRVRSDRGLVWILDGKPLPISGISTDRQAGYGRAARSMAKGYKLHLLAGKQGQIAAWRIAPMNKDERVMGARLLREAQIQGYVVADANYDSNTLHKECANRELQLVVPRRYGPGKGTGHRVQAPGRLRSRELLEQSCSGLGQALLRQRSDIERLFGNLTNWGGGLTHLPPWVRTHRRVHRWVQAKLILMALKQRLRAST